MIFDLKSFVRDFFDPLTAATKSTVELKKLFGELGYVVRLDAEQAEAAKSALRLAELVPVIKTAVEAVGDGELTVSEITTLTNALAEGAGIIRAIMEADLQQLALPPDPFGQDQFWEEIAARIPEYLLLSWLDCNLSPVYEMAHFAGVITEEPATDVLPEQRHLHLNLLGNLFSAPGDQIAGTYDWGGDFAHADFLINLSRFLDAFDLFPDMVPLRASMSDLLLGAGSTETAYEMNYAPAVLSRLLPGLSLELLLAPFAPGGGEASGLALVAASAAEANVSLTPTDGMEITASASGQFAFGAGVSPAGVDAIAGASDVTLDAGFNFRPPVPLTLFGKSGATRLEFRQLNISADLGFEGASPVMGLAAGLGSASEDGVALVIAPGDADNFIAQLLGDKEIEIGAGLGLRWTSTGTLVIEGGAGFEIELPVDFKAGPIEITKILIGVWGSPEGIDLEFAISGGLDLAVLQIAAEEVGIELRLKKPEDGGTPSIGPFDFLTGLKPPRGLGLAIDAAGLVRGGGYLDIDREIGRYAGVAQVGIFALDLSAIGIIDTQLPDKPDGWSLFLAIFSEFPPIQLGFGFALLGVGGLIGINRTIDQDALFDRMISGALDSIMFPEDPIANAPRIIEDISAIFPAADGQFLFGAMFKLGWGTPALVDADIGLILELPTPFRILLLGQVSVALPVPDAAVVELNLDVAGLLDLTAGTFELNALLRDSHIARVIHLSGGMSMKAVFKGQPDMIFSIGGFHSEFTPPEGFRTPKRISAAIPVGSIADVSLSGFMAITSNTFQAGGKITIYARLSGFTAEGWLEIEALIQFSPFSFDVRTSFGVSVRMGRTTLMGVDVEARVLGPSPIEVFGFARFEILEFKKKIDIHLTTAGDKPRITVTENLSEILTEAFSAEGALQAFETIAPVVFAGEETGVDPAAVLSLIQKIAPLEEALKKFGEADIEGADLFAIDDISINGLPLDPALIEEATDWFARAQFFKMGDDEKLVAPSFEEMPAGVTMRSEGDAMPGTLSIADDYEEIVLTGEKQKGAKKIGKPVRKFSNIDAMTVLPSVRKARKMTAPSGGHFSISTAARKMSST